MIAVNLPLIWTLLLIWTLRFDLPVTLRCDLPVDLVLITFGTPHPGPDLLRLRYGGDCGGVDLLLLYSYGAMTLRCYNVPAFMIYSWLTFTLPHAALVITRLLGDYVVVHTVVVDLDLI